MSEQTGKPDSSAKLRARKAGAKPRKGSNGNGHDADFEEVQAPPDPLEDLIARATKEAGIAHLPETVAALHTLRGADRRRFVELFSALRKVDGVRSVICGSSSRSCTALQPIWVLVKKSAVETLLRLAVPAEAVL